MDEEELSTKQDRLKEGGQGNQELTASDAKDQSAGETSVQLNLDELPEQQPEHGTASASTTATLEPATSNSFQQAHSPAEDSLDSAGVEIVTVMPDEELEPVQPLEATDELEETQERQPPPGVSLQLLTLNTAAEDDSPEIEEIECLPPSASDGGQLSATAPELPQEQSSSAATAQITESAIIEAMELDDPIVETVQFTAGSSSETVLEEEEPLPAAENHKETTATSAAELNELEYLEEEEEEDSSDQPTNSQQSTITDAATILESDSSKDGTSASENVAPPAPEPEMPESSDLFKDVKFAVCEDLNDIDKIKRVLVNSGAKFLNYLSDSATHLIADNAEHLNVSEAIDIYEKPVVTSQWVWLSLRSHKVLPLAPFSPFRDRLFSSLVACPSRLSPADQQSIWSMITYYGGRYQTTLDGSCTHLITTAISGAKYEAAESSTKCKVVTPDWVLECVKKKSLIDVERYHPKLLSTYNAGQKVKGGTTTKSSATMAAEKSSASNKVDDEMAIFTRSTKAVTMAISTEAVLSRKVEPFKPELTLEQPAASVPTTVQQSVNAHSLLLRPAATAGSGQQISGSATNVQMQHQRPLVPNSTGMVAYPRNPHPQQQQHPQVHPHAHPHPQTQQSKAVQLVNHHNAYALQQQQHNCPNRHLAPMVAQGQQGNVQHQQTMLVQQHQHMAQQHHQQQQPMTPAQAKKAKQGQVHAVKSKGPAKGAAKGAGGKKSQQQQAQQHLMQHGHLGAEHGGGQMEQSMLQHPQGLPSGGHPVSQANYHPGASLMQQQQQQHSQMVNNQMHSPTYRPPHSPAMVQQQQQMGGMVQQVPQQQQPQQVQLQQAGHPQGQPQSRQVYLTLQQQQQMQFVNGQGQFVRGQFITRAPQPQQQQQSLLQQQQHPQHPPIGPNVPNQGMPPGSPAPGQQMYRHPSPQQQQQFQQMQQQQVQRPMYAQMTPQGQVYVSQHPQTMQRMPMQGQQVQLQQQTSQAGQPVSVQQQQAMMNQNQYNHQQQQQQMTAAVHPQEVGGQTAAASISPGSGLQQYQQQHPGPQRMPVNMIRMSSLTPEQQQQILQQQQKMQQQAQAQQQQQSAAGYATAMQQQQAQSGQQAMQIRPVTPSSGQPSPQTPPQLLSPSGTPVPQQRMMMRPTMHPQVQQQQVYGQMVDPTKVPQSQQQIAVRPQVQMQQQGPPGQQVPQQFTPQQVQFIRQRWATPVSEQQQQQQQYPGGKPPQHQFVHMTATGPRQMVVTQGQGPPQHLTPQQQQMWLQQQQARQRFVLQQQQQQQQSPRMMRMPMNNGPMPVQQMQPQQATAQQQQHPVGGMASLGGHDPTKVRISPHSNHSSTEIVSTSITAVVGGGVETVIASSQPAVIPPQALANQQQHFASHQPLQGTVGPGGDQVQGSVSKAILVQQQQQAQQSAQHSQAVQQASQPAPNSQSASAYSTQPTGGTGSSTSSTNSSSASTPTSSSGSVVNEKTKTALANMLNNRLNQQAAGQQQQQAAPSPTTPTTGGAVRDQVAKSAPTAANQPTPNAGSIQRPVHLMVGPGAAAAATTTTPVATPAANLMTQQQPQATTQPTPSPAVMSSAPSHDQLASHGQAPAATAGVHHGHVLPSVQQHNATLGPNGPQPSSFGIHHQPPASPFASGPQTPAQHQPLPPAGQVPPMNGPIANLAHGPMGPRSAGALLPAGHAHAHPVHPSMHPLHGHHPQVGPAGVQPTTNGTTPAPVPPASPHPQVVQIRFYGQDARQPIPPEFCLIGCVFYISPTYTENVLTAKLVPGWKRRIEQYGGRVVDSYVSGPANTVTHFVTEHMIGGLQKLALSEGKRCVSIFWLDDVLGNRRLLPPWRFYHLPLAYSHNKPCRNHIIAISNFEGEERQIMRQLIARTGAIFTDYLTSKNTILICKKLEGPKYEKALQWRIAIVNLYWLQDVLFGLPETLQLSSLSKKYQQFEQYANASIITSNSNLTPSQMLQRDIFRVEYNSVTGLMSPWRYPIKFDQEDLAVRMKKADEERQREEAKRREEEERRAEQLRVETRREEEEKERLEEDMETAETAPERMDQEGGLILQSDATPGSNTEKQVRQLTLESAPAQAATKRSFDELASVEREEQNQIQTNAVSESTTTQVDAEPAAEELPLKRIKLEEDCQDSVTTVVEQNLELQAEQPMEVEEEEKPSTAALDAAELQKEASIDESASQGEPEIEVIEIPVGSSTAGNQESDEKKKEAEEQVPSEPVPETSHATVEAPEAKIEEKQPDEPTATPSEESVTIKEEDSDEAKTDDPEIEVVQMDQVSKAVPSPGQQSAEAAKPLISEPVPTVNGGDQPADTDTTTEEDSSITKVAPSIPVMVAEITENSTHSTDESSTTATHFKVPLANAASTSSTTTVSPTPPPAVRLVAVLFTAIDAVSRDELRTIVDNLGGKVVGDPDQCTHLIADRIVPTVKYLCAFARAQYVLTSEWLRECARSGAFVEESTYQLADRHSASQYQVDLPRALSTRSAALFKDTVFLLTRSCIPSPSILQRIIQANGGAAVLYKSPSRRQLALLRERKITFVVVSCETDLHTCDQFFENQIKVVTAQAILNAIFRQQLDYDAYAFRSAKSTSPGTKTPTTPPPNGVHHHQMLLSSATPMATLNQ